MSLGASRPINTVPLNTVVAGRTCGSADRFPGYAASAAGFPGPGLVPVPRWVPWMARNGMGPATFAFAAQSPWVDS